MSVEKFLASFEAALHEGRVIKLVLNRYRGTEPALKKIIIRRIVLRGAEALSFTMRYQTRDIVKNYPPGEARDLLAAALNNEWDHAILYTPQHDVLFERKGDKILLRKMKPSEKDLPEATHDQEKTRLIKPAAAGYLTALKLADAQGRILPSGQDKYRQINKFIEIFAALVTEKTGGALRHVVDMGSGKGYLTFAVYDYLTHMLETEVAVTGVELRPDMVALGNQVAQDCGFSGLQFVQGSIKDYHDGPIDALIALHACDTATDEAIACGIKAGAQVILCAPCCHKQIRREMTAHKKANELDFLLQYGTFLERQAEMVTDGLRALILNAHGYKTKVFEFISDEHTPKNVMITAVKAPLTGKRRALILAEIAAAKQYFGITRHHLETLLEKT